MIRLLMAFCIGMVPLYAHADTVLESSFEGMKIDINGIRVDLPMIESLRRFNPRFRFRKYRWPIAVPSMARMRVGEQSWSQGSYSKSKEQYKVTPTEWHTGTMIRRLIRQVDIRADHLRPRVTDIRQAILNKYGNPTEERKPGFAKRLTHMIYTVKNGKFVKAPCYKFKRSFYSTDDDANERVAKYQNVLKDIKQFGYCDAILILHYNPRYDNPDRVGSYGARLRDFKLEAKAFIADIKLKQQLIKQHQQSLPNVKPKL